MNFTFTVFAEHAPDSKPSPRADTPGQALLRLLFRRRPLPTEIAPCVLGSAGDLAYGGTTRPALRTSNSAAPLPRQFEVEQD